MTISKQIMDTWPEWWSIAKYQIPISKRFDFVVWGYAGYGQCSIPAVVLLRDLKDKEQQTHADRLLPFIKDYVTVLTESNTDTQSLQQALESQLHAPPWHNEILNLKGAELSALTLAEGIACEE